MSHPQTVIDWNYAGKPDGTVGTGATRAERRLAYAAALASPLLYLGLWRAGRLDWAWWQYLLAAAVGADLAAGMVANALNSCKRFYHSQPGSAEPAYFTWLRRPLVFTALHVYPCLVALAFPGGSLAFGFGWYALVLVAALSVQRVPTYLQRPVAIAWLLLTILLNAYLIPPPTGFEWMGPVLVAKIVVGHMVVEEPYRPLADGDGWPA